MSAKRSEMDRTVYLQIRPCLPFFRKRSPDGATTNWGSRHPVAAYYLSNQKGWKADHGLVGWPIADGLPTQVVTRQLYRSSAGQGSSPAKDLRSTAVSRRRKSRRKRKRREYRRWNRRYKEAIKYLTSDHKNRSYIASAFINVQI